MKIGDGFRIGKSHFASMDMARAATTDPENYNLGEPIEEESSSKKKSSVKTPKAKNKANKQAMDDAKTAGISTSKSQTTTITAPKSVSNANGTYTVWWYNKKGEMKYKNFNTFEESQEFLSKKENEYREAQENSAAGKTVTSSKTTSSVKTPTPKASSNTQDMKDAQAAGISSAKIPTPKPESNAQAMKDAQAAGTATSSSSSAKSSEQSKGGQAGPNSWSLEKQGKKAGGGARNLMAKE